GRGIEHTMLRELAGAAGQRGLRHIHIAFAATPRNAPAERFLSQVTHGTSFRRPTEAGTGFALPLEDVDALRPWYARSTSAASVELDTEGGRNVDRRLSPARAFPFERIATELADVQAIQNGIARMVREKRAASHAEYIEPSTAIEHALCEM